MLLTFCIRITNYQDFIFTYLAANCIRARAHLPETLLNMFKNPAIIKSGRKLPPDENCRRCSTNFENLSTEDQFIWLLPCEDKEIISLTSKLLIDLFKERIRIT